MKDLMNALSASSNHNFLVIILLILFALMIALLGGFIAFTSITA